MAAVFKSHVLLRDEKGLFGIPFKRLLLAGVMGGLSYTLFNLTRSGSTLIAAALAVGVTLILTAPRGGLPLWQRLVYRWRGSLLLHAARMPNGISAWLCQTLDLPVTLVQLDGAQVFVAAQGDSPLDLREWVTFAHARESDGLVFVDAPLREGWHEPRADLSH